MFIKKMAILIKKNKVASLFIFLIAAPIIACSYYFLANYQDDNEPRYFFYSLAPFSKIIVAEKDVGNATRHTSLYIQKCKRFPDSLKDVKSIIPDDAPADCKSYFEGNSKNIVIYFQELDQPPWIDPWGRPYQIRYDREKRIIQLRSQGRYLWTESDDIKKETTFGVVGQDFTEEMNRCDLLPKDNMTCIFNRGWH